MKSCFANIIFVLGMCVSLSPAAEPTVKEVRQRDGNSVIEITAADGCELASYTIDMARHHHPATGPDDKLVEKFRSWKFGAFLCFNSNQYSGAEFCTSKDPVKDFQPTALDVRQWIKTIKDAGMTYAVLTARHTSEFLLWDSATSRINVMNSAVKMDLVKEYVDECRKQGIEPGIYYCLWGSGWRPNPNARAIILAQLHELATRYGKIPYFWLDMPHHVGWLAKDLSQQEIYDALKNVNPDSIVMFNNTIGDGSVVKAFPTDVINGEMCSPPAKGHEPYRVVDGKRYYLPFEYEPCSQRRGTQLNGQWDFAGAAWFTYGSGKHFEASTPLPPAFLYQRIRIAYKRGANSVLLACAPDHTGLFRKEDVVQLVELGRMLNDPSLAPPESLAAGCKASSSGNWNPGYAADKAFDDNPATRWAGAKDTKSGWLEVDFGKSAMISKAVINEGWDRVRKFSLQYKVGEEWRNATEGTTIGANRELTFKPISARVFCLNITEATDAPTIWEFQLFEK